MDRIQIVWRLEITPATTEIIQLILFILSCFCLFSGGFAFA